jgi:EmrB/QacA subfamily drug resistance transporter
MTSRLRLALLLVPALAYSISQTMITPALPAIQRELGATTAEAGWVLTAFFLSAAVVTPMAGRLGDLLGKDRVLVAVLCLFAAGSLLGALAQTIEVLIAARAIQGASGAIFPLAVGLARDTLPPKAVARGVGWISGAFGFGAATGLVLSGPVVDGLSYHWIFWLALAPIAAAGVGAHLFLPRSPVRARVRVDWIGGGLLGVALVTLLLAVTRAAAWGWRSGALLLACSVSAWVWGRHELRTPEPMVDLRLLRTRALWTTNVAAFLLSYGMFSFFLLLPQLVHAPVSTGYGFGASVTQAGLFLLPLALLILVAGPASGALAGRVGPRVPLVCGTLIVSGTLAALAFAHDRTWEILATSALLGTGLGLSLAALANLVIAAVPATETGVSTGIMQIMRMAGGSLGAAVAAAVLAGAATRGRPRIPEAAFALAFLLAAGAALGAFVAALAIPRATLGRSARMIERPVGRTRYDRSA